MGETLERGAIRVFRIDVLGHFACRGIVRASQVFEADAQWITGQSEHAAELSATQHTYTSGHAGSAGSGWRNTPSVCSRRYRFRAALISGYLGARMAAARRAAFMAPGFPIARVATGTPAGIC